MVDSLARAFHTKYNIKANDVVIVFAPNSIYYTIALWAAFRLGAIASCGNPTYTSGELSYQIEAVAKSHPVKLMVTWPEASFIETATTAADKAGLPANKIILMEDFAKVGDNRHKMHTVPGLIKEHGKSTTKVPYYQYKKGECRTKTAFLSFSSGTTGVFCRLV